MNALSLATVLAAALGAGSTGPVILDTDIGDDIDDIWALAAMLGAKDIDLRLIVTAHGDTPERTRLLAKQLESMGRTDIPIGTGHKTGDEPHRQMEWVGDYRLEDYPGKVHDDGVAAAIELIQDSDTPVTILAIGPQTNLAEALRRDPSIANNARVVCMAGSVYKGYQDASEPAAEWNVKQDVTAARMVFSVPWDITLVPLDSCGAYRLTGEAYKTVAESDAVRAKTVIENYDAWTNRGNYPENESSVLFDAVAVFFLLDESQARFETLNLTVDEAGRTVPGESGRPVRCALELRDEKAMDAFLVETLTR